MTGDPTVGTNEAILRIAKDVWWLLLIRGVVAIAFGIVALVWPGKTAWVMALIFGVFAIVDGLSAIVRAVQARKVVTGWVWWMIAGVISLVVGIVVIAWPKQTVLVVLYLIGFWAIVVGILEVIGSIHVRSVGGQWVPTLVAGLLAVLFGLLLVIFPGGGILGLVWLLGIFAILYGVFLLVGVFQIRSAAKRAGVV